MCVCLEFSLVNSRFTRKVGVVLKCSKPQFSSIWYFIMISVLSSAFQGRYQKRPSSFQTVNSQVFILPTRHSSHSIRSQPWSARSAALCVLSLSSFTVEMIYSKK
ncbi:unnamed protein product [Arctogadus glacialis]